MAQDLAGLRRKAVMDQLGGDEPQMQTQGGTFTDPRWTNGTWGSGEPRNTGISGIMNDPGGIQAPPLETTPATPAAPAAPDYTSLGQFAGGLKGYDMGKFDRPADQWSEKYKIGAVQSHFDPTQGITPEFLSALNGLDIGTFSGSGDKLSVADPRNGFRSKAGGTSDVVQGLKSGNGNWTYWEDPTLAGSDPQMAQSSLLPATGSQAPMTDAGAGDDAALEAIRAELDAVINGRSSPMQREQLLQLLGAA
jgi:hypothetical protein